MVSDRQLATQKGLPACRRQSHERVLVEGEEERAEEGESLGDLRHLRGTRGKGVHELGGSSHGLVPQYLNVQ